MRPLTQEAIEEHCAHFGLQKEIVSHTPVSQLAAGEKIKIVLAAAMWLNPHIVIMDEPTNYLDRHGLAALTQGLKNYGGGVVIISHNKEFADTIATEQWVMTGPEPGPAGFL